MQLKSLSIVLFVTIIGSATPAAVGPSNVFTDNQDGWDSLQLSLATKQLVITSTTTVNIACAKLVNVSGACRRRRGLWMEEPIVLSFDEETEKLVEILYTPVYSIEPTVVAKIAVNDYPSESNSGTTVTNINDGRLVTSMPESRFGDLPNPRIHMLHLLKIVKWLVSAITPARPGVLVTSSAPVLPASPVLPVLPAPAASSVSLAETTSPVSPVISTETTSSNTVSAPALLFVETLTTVTLTNTFFIQVCTPSPFPFPECTQLSEQVITQNAGR